MMFQEAKKNETIGDKPLLLYLFSMVKFKSQRKSDHMIFQLLGHITKEFLAMNASQVIEFFDDSRRLCEHFKDDLSYEDYTFLVTSAFKGLEMWLFAIAPSLGFTETDIAEAKKPAKGTGVLVGDLNKLAALFVSILDTVEGTPEVKDSLKMEVLALKGLVKNYRHEIAHCWKTIELPSEAQQHFSMIVGNVRRITEKLSEAGLLKGKL